MVDVVVTEGTLAGKWKTGCGPSSARDIAVKAEEREGLSALPISTSSVEIAAGFEPDWRGGDFVAAIRDQLKAEKNGDTAGSKQQ